MLLAFFSALAKTGEIGAGAIDRASSDPRLSVFLLGWIGAFYVGELLLAIALLRGGTTRNWIPVMLILHVALFPVSNFLPDEVQSLTVLLITVGLAGVGITAAAERDHPVPA
jgi:hypothetical protein